MRGAVWNKKDSGAGYCIMDGHKPVFRRNRDDDKAKNYYGIFRSDNPVGDNGFFRIYQLAAGK